MVATGAGDATFTLTPKNEWDVCAGVALVREAGGTITDRHGKPLRFNQRGTTVPGVIATNARLFDPVCRLIDEIAPLIVEPDVAAIAPPVRPPVVAPEPELNWKFQQADLPAFTGCASSASSAAPVTAL